MSRSPTGTTIDLHIPLKPHHKNALIDTPDEVRDPRHIKHVLLTTPPLVPVLTRTAALLQICRTAVQKTRRRQLAELVAPHPNMLELVNIFEHHGVPSSSISTTHGGRWLTLIGVAVPQASELLGALYQRYRLAGTNDTTVLHAIGYTLPAVLCTHIQTVALTSYFASTRPPRRRFVGTAATPAK